jgi:hypothetical protein
MRGLLQDAPSCENRMQHTAQNCERDRPQHCPTICASWGKSNVGSEAQIRLPTLPLRMMAASTLVIPLQSLSDDVLTYHACSIISTSLVYKYAARALLRSNRPSTFSQIQSSFIQIYSHTSITHLPSNKVQATNPPKCTLSRSSPP